MRRICFCLMLLPFLAGCGNRKMKPSGAKLTGYTNFVDQEYLMISQEFDAKNYAKAIDFVDRFFKENSLKEDTIKLLLLKARAREKLRETLTDSRRHRDLVKKYAYQVSGGRVRYLFEEYRKIWQEFPDTEYGKAAFRHTVEAVTNLKERIADYEKYIRLVKDSRHARELKYELSRLYLKGAGESRYASGLLKIYKGLLKTSYHDDVLLNYHLLKYRMDRNLKAYRSGLEVLVKEKRKNFPLALYLLGDLAFIENHLDRALEYYRRAGEGFKDLDEKNLTEGLIAGADGRGRSFLSRAGGRLDRKIKLIDRIQAMRKNLVNRNFAVINGERVRVRKTPALARNNVITSLNYGDRVILLSQSEKKEKAEGDEDYWYSIQLTDNTTGWVFGKYLIFFTY